jgi:hypothetical protein
MTGETLANRGHERILDSVLVHVCAFHTLRRQRLVGHRVITEPLCALGEWLVRL